MIKKNSEAHPREQREFLERVINHRLMTEEQWRDVAVNLGFSNREAEVCKHLFCGETREGIAGKLEIKVRTVRQYMENIHKKLNVNNRVGVVLRIVAARDQLNSIAANSRSKVSMHGRGPNGF